MVFVLHSLAPPVILETTARRGGGMRNHVVIAANRGFRRLSGVRDSAGGRASSDVDRRAGSIGGGCGRGTLQPGGQRRRSSGDRGRRYRIPEIPDVGDSRTGRTLR
jgi:hypothetical protein